MCHLMFRFILRFRSVPHFLVLRHNRCIKTIANHQIKRVKLKDTLSESSEKDILNCVMSLWTVFGGKQKENLVSGPGDRFEKRSRHMTTTRPQRWRHNYGKVFLLGVDPVVTWREANAALCRAASSFSGARLISSTRLPAVRGWTSTRTHSQTHTRR